MATHSDVLIIGGGIIGLTTAFALAKQGVRVTVLDKGDPGMEASWAGAGIIPPGNPEFAATAYDKLRAVSSNMFPAFSSELQSITGIDNGYRVCGGVEFLAEDAEQIVAAWRSENVEFTLLQPGGYSSDESTYLLPGMAQVRNPWHVHAILEACKHHRVKLRSRGEVASIDHTENKVTDVRLATGELLTAGRYLIASGAWSDRLLQPLGLQSNIFPVRGQIALMKTPTPVLRRILLAGKNYLVPREDGHVLIGSTEEPEAGFVKENTTGAIEYLLGFALELAPALAQAELVKAWAGLRPGSLDGMPSLGRVGDFQNLYLASGHFRAGIQLSPATALVMSELLMDKAPSIALEDFRPGRPPAPAVKMAFHS